MRIFQLRTYHLCTAEAAKAYLPHWERHIESLKQFGVETHGFFTVPSAPERVMAIISMDDHLDPEVVASQYLQSEALRQDMEGFDVTQIKGVDTLVLAAGRGSPLC